MEQVNDNNETNDSRELKPEEMSFGKEGYGFQKKRDND